MTCLSWVALHGMAHNFIELDKSVVYVITLVSFLSLWFLSVCPLRPSLSAYCLSAVSLTLDVGYLLSASGLSSAAQPPLTGCESWTIKKADCQRIDAFELCCWRRLLRVPWTARRSNQSILKEISPECSLEGLLLKLKLQYFGHLM